ncbi:MAG: hypothetical protein HKM89_09900, partial [Gemmatimonadales bacterium]|nr:hypothetical protein [Gemmatimonadales bacterium]
VIACDMVIKAVGQAPRSQFATDAGLTLEGDRIRSDKPHVFVGGDCMSGGAEIVNAAAEGKQAAREIDDFLKANS